MCPISADPAVKRYLESLLERCDFPPPGSPITIAVSGGADSMALLVLAVAAECRVTVIHVDHGLRNGSHTEADLVRTWAYRWNAEFISKTVTVHKAGGLEAAARGARYAVLPSNIATGHTMNDQAETVLINLMRGAGLDGLSGMTPGPTHPILRLTREETSTVCDLLGIEPFNDPSNSDPAIMRNRVRHELIPLMREISGKDVVPIITRQTDLLRDEGQLLERLAIEACDDPTNTREVSSLASPLARRVIRNWLARSGATTPTGGRKSNGDVHPPTGKAVQDVLEVAKGLKTGVHIPGGYNVSRHHGHLSIDKITG